jgi:hypothetical protein
MSKSKNVSPRETESGVSTFSDIDAIEPMIANIQSFVHSTDDDIEITGKNASVAGLAFPPDGKATGTISATVTDQNGNPVSGQRVSFNLSHVRPSGNWRSASGLKALYNQNNGNGTKAASLVNQGIIRVVGSLNTSSAITGNNGVASVIYQTSHIASDFRQSSRAQEKVVTTLSNGSKRSLNLNIGWTGLQQIQSVSGGLRVVGAIGTRVHPDLRKFLKNLGDAVKGANWPYPVTVTAACLRWGGQYPPHFTHKHGLTLDLRPMSTDGNSTWSKQNGTSASNYDLPRTKLLIKTLKNSGAIVFFNGKGAGGQTKAGHDNHLHATWLSSKVTMVTAPGNVIT